MSRSTTMSDMLIRAWAVGIRSRTVEYRYFQNSSLPQTSDQVPRRQQTQHSPAPPYPRPPNQPNSNICPWGTIVPLFRRRARCWRWYLGLSIRPNVLDLEIRVIVSCSGEADDVVVILHRGVGLCTSVEPKQGSERLTHIPVGPELPHGGVYSSGRAAL
jgi:hypothetical protein